MTAVNNNIAGSSFNWKHFTFGFIASAGSSTTIAFMNADPVTDFANGLDEVTVAP